MLTRLTFRSALCLGILYSASLSSVLLVFPTAAHASSDDDATVSIARERFKEGVSYFDQKQYDKARAAFVQAYALKKHPAVLLNLAQSELRSGHEADAAKHFSSYLRDSKDAGDTELQAAETGFAAAKAVVTEVVVSVDERGAEIYVDDTLEGLSPLASAVYVTPGSHTIEARKEGRSISSRVDATAARRLVVGLEFIKPPTQVEPVPPEPTNVEPGRRPFFAWLVGSPVGVVGLTLTGVGLGGGVGFAFASKSEFNNADSVASQIAQTASLDSGMARPNTQSLCVDPSAWLMGVGYDRIPLLADRAQEYGNACSKYQDDVHGGNTLRTISEVGFVVSGVAAIGTVIAYFVDSNAYEKRATARAPRPEWTLLPSLGPGERGLSLRGSF